MMDFVIDGGGRGKARVRNLQRRADPARGRSRSGHRRDAPADRGVHRQRAGTALSSAATSISSSPSIRRAAPITAALPPRRWFPRGPPTAKAGSRRRPSICDEIVAGDHVAFVYAHADGTVGRNRRSERLGARMRRACQPRRERAGDHAASRARRVELQPSRPARGRRRARAVGRRGALPQLRRSGAHDDRTRRRHRAEDSRQRGVHRARQRCAAWASNVERVERSEIWTSSTTTGDAATFAHRVAANETIFNPNKHRLDGARARRARDRGEVWIETAARDDAGERLGKRIAASSGSPLRRHGGCSTESARRVHRAGGRTAVERPAMQSPRSTRRSYDV